MLPLTQRSPHADDTGMSTREDPAHPHTYLVCDECGIACLLVGPVARAIAADPPECHSCGHRMRVGEERLAS